MTTTVHPPKDEDIEDASAGSWVRLRAELPGAVLLGRRTGFGGVVGRRRRRLGRLDEPGERHHPAPAVKDLVDDVVKALRMQRISKSQGSEMAKPLDEVLDAFRNRPLDGGPYT